MGVRGEVYDGLSIRISKLLKNFLGQFAYTQASGQNQFKFSSAWKNRRPSCSIMFDFFSLRNCISYDISYVYGECNLIFNLIYSIRAKQSSLHLFSSPNRLQGICSWLLILESNPPTSPSRNRTSGRPMTNVYPPPTGPLTSIDSGCSGDRTTPMLPTLLHGVFQ